jgi:Holliday junction resolvase RusA-like endonuclease
LPTFITLTVTRSTAEFSVIGVEPSPQGSKRYVGGNRASGGRFIEASKKLEPWRRAIADAVEWLFTETGDRQPFTQPVKVTAVFVLPRPKTIKETIRLWPIVPPDLDKLARGLGDSISLDRYAKLLADDSLIVEWDLRKIYGTPETMGVHCRIELADDTRAK